VWCQIETLQLNVATGEPEGIAGKDVMEEFSGCEMMIYIRLSGGYFLVKDVVVADNTFETKAHLNNI
jgi:hypothetical protein